MTKEEISLIADELYLDALQASGKNEVPISACLVYKDKDGNQKKIINHNHTTSRTVISHAEMVVIFQALSSIDTPYLSEASLFVTLEPCPMCMGAIIKSKIKHLYYFADDEKEGSLSFYHAPIDGKIEVIRVEDDRFKNLLSSYFENLRHKEHEH